MSLVLYFVALLLCGTFGVPTTIPYLGISQNAPTGSQSTIQKEGQLVTGVSQITSFSFWIASPSSSPQTGEASVGLWSSSGVTVIETISITLPSTISTSYVQVTANMGVSGLDPRNTYIIYFTFPTSTLRQFVLAQLPASSGFGAVSYYGPQSSLIGVNYWSTNSFDYIFTLVSDNTISVPNTNYATGPAGNSQGWSCIYQTTFTKIQVNWQTLLVNTAFVGTSSTILWNGNSMCPSSSAVFVPYGTAGSCNGNNYAVIDLSGTFLKVADTFYATGWYPTGSATPSNNGQTYTLTITGSCGTEVTSEVLAAGSPTVSGFYLKVAYV